MKILEGGNRFRILQGDILQHKDAILVCPVNCVAGVMGAGLALAFKKRFPKLDDVHSHHCLLGTLGIGSPTMFVRYESGEQNRRFIFFPTKDHWRSPSEYSYIFIGLANLYKLLRGFQPEAENIEIAMPSLGCGLGGLDPRAIHGMIAAWTMCLPERFQVSVYHTHESGK